MRHKVKSELYQKELTRFALQENRYVSAKQKADEKLEKFLELKANILEEAGKIEGIEITDDVQIIYDRKEKTIYLVKEGEES